VITIISCKKCGEDLGDESLIELHHLVPKFMGGTDKDGRCYLCKKHHSILHNIIVKLIFDCIPDNKKQGVRDYIKSFTLRYIKKKD